MEYAKKVFWDSFDPKDCEKLDEYQFLNVDNGKTFLYAWYPELVTLLSSRFSTLSFAFYSINRQNSSAAYSYYADIKHRGGECCLIFHISQDDQCSFDKEGVFNCEINEDIENQIKKEVFNWLADQPAHRLSVVTGLLTFPKS